MRGSNIQATEGICDMETNNRPHPPSIPYRSLPPQEKLFSRTVCRTKNSPSVTKIRLCAFLGCRSALDSGRDTKTFFDASTSQKPQSLRLTVAPSIAIDRAWSNQSGGIAYCSQESKRRDNLLPKKRHFDLNF